MDYDATAMPAVYDAGRGYSPQVLDLWLSTIARIAGAQRPIHDILDLGCGTGRYSGALSEHFGASVVAIDPSEKMLARARRKAAARVRYRARSVLRNEGVFSGFKGGLSRRLVSPTGWTPMRSFIIAAVVALAFSTGAVAGRHPAVPAVRAEPRHCAHGQLCGRTCIPRTSICHKPKPPPQEQPCRDEHGKFVRCAGRHPA